MPEKLIERRWLIFWAIFLIIITTIPYIIGFQTAKNSDYQFSGFLFGVEDGNSYLAKMLSGSQGDWLFRTPYSAYPQSGFFAFFPYIFLGKLAISPDVHTQLITLFQVFRWVGIFFLVFEVYWFTSLFTNSVLVKRLAVVISTVGGGLGWMGVIISTRLPLDFYSPEAFGFLSVLGLPHLLFARGFMLRGIRLILQPEGDLLHPHGNIHAGISILISGIFQPLIIPLTWLIVGVWRSVQWIILKQINFREIIRSTIWFFAIPLPLFLYNAVMFLFDPYLSSWEGQNIIKSPPPQDFLLAYLIGFVCVGFIYFQKKSALENRHFLLTWCLLLPFLVYLPINLQRRLSDGYWVVLSIFIAAVLSRIRKPIIRPLALGLISFSSIFLLIGSMGAAVDLQMPVFQPRTTIATFEAIGKMANKKEVVLAPYEVSNMLPAYIPMRVVNGHGPESKSLKEIEMFTADFFAQQNLVASEPFFDEFKVAYVIFPADRILDASAWWYQNARLIFENENYSVFDMKEDLRK